MTFETVSSARRVWLYLEDRDAPLIDVGDPLSDAGLLAGAVCTAVAARAVVGGGQVIVRAQNQHELADLLGSDGQVFVPGFLADAAGLLTSRLSKFRGRLWFEDTYSSRFALANYVRPCAPLAAVGLVGSAVGTSHEPGVEYACWCDDATDSSALVAAMAAGVADIWVVVNPSTDVDASVRRVTDASHAAGLFSLFGGATAAELARSWEQRVCLAAGRALEAGHQLADDDLLSVSGGGLSVDLRPRVVGRRLRYGLAAGAPLTFGVLEC